MKLLRLFYKPFALFAGLISARLGRKMFQSLWAKIDDAPPPAPTAPGAGLGKVVGAAALEAATMASARATVDRASARTFHYLIGVWPSDKPPAAVAETSPPDGD
jgi:hypothetical protein